jgi:acyl-coenzyme A synthetase/AMP-(fatty) acid ligase
MDRTTGRGAYRAARDILVRHRDDYDGAVAAFRWPAVGERFNWALDWFDAGWPPNRPTADAIFAHARQNLAAYQRIRRIEFMELPKTISGKIRRVDLRARENSCEPDALMDEYRDR